MVGAARWLWRLGTPIAVATFAFALARMAMLPGLGYWDTAEFQAVGPLLGTAHPAGFPTFVLLGWLASVILQPFGEPAFRMNLLAGLCLGIAAGITTDLVRTLTRSTLLGLAAGIGLALTPEAWRIGTHAEAHALHLVFVVLLLRLLVGWEDAVRDTRPGSGAGATAGSASRWLLAASLLFALSVGNHSLTLLLAPPITLYVRAVEPRVFQDRRLVATCAAIIAITLVLVYLELPLRAGPFRAPLVYGRPETWEGFWYVVLGEQFRGNVIGPFADLAGSVASLVGQSAVQLGPLPPFIPLAFVVTAMRRPAYALLTGLAALITCLFSVSYENAEIGRYYLGPLLMAWTWLAVLARAVFDALAPLLGEGMPAAGRSRATGSGPPRVLPPLLLAAAATLLVVPALMAAPDRYRAVNEAGDTAAQHWVEAALARMPPGAVVVSWWSYSTPLWYAQLIDGRRPDLVVIDDRTRLDEGLGDITDVIDAHLGHDPVFVIRDDPAEAALLAERYELEFLDGFDARSLTRVLGRRSGS